MKEILVFSFFSTKCKYLNTVQYRTTLTTAYTRSDKRVMDIINQEAQIITNTLELADRIDTIAEKAAYITLKDHKDNVRNNPTCRLINPTKSEIGKIAKQTLDRINRELLKATNVNQWKTLML